ncbi:unnamed protein product [Vicia faba]|uniref:Fibrillarin n=1 Tax=Vicia faba TaxID=3906 RepID=A0AAV0ZX21_VICFA|nr:unnamed protein product [Vicia faba]
MAPPRGRGGSGEGFRGRGGGDRGGRSFGGGRGDRALNASYYLKAGGHFVISIKANCIDSTVPAEAVFISEVNKLRADQFKPFEQVTLEPFERDQACVIGGYRMPKKKKDA